MFWRYTFCFITFIIPRKKSSKFFICSFSCTGLALTFLFHVMFLFMFASALHYVLFFLYYTVLGTSSRRRKAPPVPPSRPSQKPSLRFRVVAAGHIIPFRLSLPPHDLPRISSNPSPPACVCHFSESTSIFFTLLILSNHSAPGICNTAVVTSRPDPPPP